jgi:hypothetical protein
MVIDLYRLQKYGLLTQVLLSNALLYLSLAYPISPVNNDGIRFAMN